MRRSRGDGDGKHEKSWRSYLNTRTGSETAVGEQGKKSATRSHRRSSHARYILSHIPIPRNCRHIKLSSSLPCSILWPSFVAWQSTLVGIRRAVACSETATMSHNLQCHTRQTGHLIVVMPQRPSSHFRFFIDD